MPEKLTREQYIKLRDQLIDVLSQSGGALDTEAAAAYIAHSPETMAKWRWLGRGPAYAKIGGRIVYRRASLDRWLAEHEVSPKTRKKAA